MFRFVFLFLFSVWCAAPADADAAVAGLKSLTPVFQNENDFVRFDALQSDVSFCTQQQTGCATEKETVGMILSGLVTLDENVPLSSQNLTFLLYDRGRKKILDTYPFASGVSVPVSYLQDDTKLLCIDDVQKKDITLWTSKEYQSRCFDSEKLLLVSGAVLSVSYSEKMQNMMTTDAYNAEELDTLRHPELRSKGLKKRDSFVLLGLLPFSDVDKSVLFSDRLRDTATLPVQTGSSLSVTQRSQTSFVDATVTVLVSKQFFGTVFAPQKMPEAQIDFFSGGAILGQTENNPFALRAEPKTLIDIRVSQNGAKKAETTLLVPSAGGAVTVTAFQDMTVPWTIAGLILLFLFGLLAFFVVRLFSHRQSQARF